GNCSQIPRYGQPRPPVIVYPRYDRHTQKADKSSKSLFFQIVKWIVKLHFTIVGTGAVQHHKADHNKDNHHGQQRLVIMSLLSGTLQSKFTPYSCSTSSLNLSPRSS